jgi:D-alanine-D-alanine ligase
LLFTKLPQGVPRIATARIKFDRDYQKKHGIKTRSAKDLPDGLAEYIGRTSRRIYRLLSMSGYARMDFRLGEDGKVYFLEANPNPNLEYGEDFAESAHAMGLPYGELLQRLLGLGLRYQFAWRG